MEDGVEYSCSYDRCGNLIQEQRGEVMAEAGAGMTGPEAAADAVMGKVYFQPDFYGSALFASDGQGQVLRHAERSIWGELKLPVSGDLDAAGFEENLWFTSYGYDPVIGKHFAGARFYGGSLGRMMGEDPVKRGLNGYIYCNNDPVNYTDPTAEIPSILIGGGAGEHQERSDQCGDRKDLWNRRDQERWKCLLKRSSLSGLAGMRLTGAASATGHDSRRGC